MTYKFEPKYHPKIPSKTVNLNLGCGTDIREYFVNLDKMDYALANRFMKDDSTFIKWDIENQRYGPDGRVLPFEDSIFDYILARDFLEHIPHRVYHLDGEFFGHLITDMVRITKPNGNWEIISPCRPECIGAMGHTRMIDETTFIPFKYNVNPRNSGEYYDCPKVLFTIAHENLRQWDYRDPLRFGRAIVKRLVFKVVK